MRTRNIVGLAFAMGTTAVAITGGGLANAGEPTPDTVARIVITADSTIAEVADATGDDCPHRSRGVTAEAAL